MDDEFETAPALETSDAAPRRQNGDIYDSEDDDGSTVKLQRSLGVFDGIMINVGIMIGTGIFISPKGVVAGVETVGATLCVWVAAGFITLLGAMCYAELGTTIRSSGGTYTYVQQVFGDCAGFLVFWADSFITVPASNAVVALLFSIYCLEPFYPDPDCRPPKIAIKLFAVIGLMVTMFVNCWSVKLTTYIQNALSLSKLIPLGILIISGMVRLGMGHTEHLQNSFASTEISGLGTAMYSCFFSYAGWHSLNTVSEELKNPSKNLPIAVIASIAIVASVYTLTNVAYFTVLSPTDLLKSNAVAFSYAEEVIGKFAIVIPITVVCSMFGCLNGSILSSSRQFFAVARRGYLPDFMATIGVRQKTPIPCIITTSVITSCFCFVDNLFTLINYYGFVKWLAFGVAVVGLIVLRIKEPERSRPFKVNILIPIIFVIICTFLTVFGFIGAPRDSLVATAIIASGIPVYIIIVRLNVHNKWIVDAKRQITIFFQKLFLVTAEEVKYI